MKLTLKPHQVAATGKLLALLKQHGGVAYLSGEVRSGKTLTALHTADRWLKGSGYVVVITSKSAISSIVADYGNSGLTTEVEVINYESVHKLAYEPDFVIVDEAHRIGRFPRPAKTARLVRQFIGTTPCILMSGTPSPESYSQLYHQFWVTGRGPWVRYTNFYSWAKTHVDIKKIYIGMALPVNDYKHAKPMVMQHFKTYSVSMTQADAGFDGGINEQVHILKLPKLCQDIMKALDKDELYTSSHINLEAGTAAMKASYFHQLSSGTIRNIDNTAVVVDSFKADYIKKKFKGKTAIFYCFIVEGELLRFTFPEWTDDPAEFAKAGKECKFIKQVRSGREGINLATADDLVFFNISYSAVSYWQARARTQAAKGGDKRVHWLFTDKGIEQSIYEAVKEKKNYTTNHFQTYIGNRYSKENSKSVQGGRKYSNTSTGHGQGRLARSIGIKSVRKMRVR